ncbi:VOC family protein [Sulfobacillus harzensis]|uniref:VOC family protein n=1 Tax=Sulfobacillus harzensis TaxID=2729629 RepID=A0A7Y0L3V0_9FIRM|nr:VOC family protein [Sulfobacillus harzensis]
MWIDHLTLAVKGRTEAMDLLSHLGSAMTAAPSWCPGTDRFVVPLANASFLEVVSVRDPLLARRSIWGGALVRFLRGGAGVFRVALGHLDLDQFIAQRSRRGVHWWPPIDDHIAGIDGTPVPVRMTQVDPMVPWLVQYLAKPSHAPNATLRLARVSIAAPAAQAMALRYHLMLGLPLQDLTHMATQNAAFDFLAGEPGYRSLHLTQGDDVIRLEAVNGQLLVDIG